MDGDEELSPKGFKQVFHWACIFSSSAHFNMDALGEASSEQYYFKIK